MDVILDLTSSTDKVPDSGFTSAQITFNPFTTNGTTTVTVTDSAHGAQVGDFVTFDSFSAIDGLDMNNEFEVITVPSASTYTVTHTSTASGSTSGGGGSGN